LSTASLATKQHAQQPLGLEAFYREQLVLIYRIVYRKVGNRQDAEDLTSSILLKAVRLLNREAGTERMGRWLMCVVQTTLIDYWRNRARVSSISLEALQEVGWKGPAERDPFGVDDRSTERVQDLLQALTERERAILTCRFLLGLTTRDTAMRLGLTEGNVKTVQHRALKHAAAFEYRVNGEMDH
jgi:RNA polymerase sigma-70 factor (ECF subfamily)